MMKFAVLILILLAVPTTQWCVGNVCVITKDIIPPEIESIPAVTTQEYPSLPESPSPPKINPSESPVKEQQPEVQPTKSETPRQAEASWYELMSNLLNAILMIFYRLWEYISLLMALITTIIIILVSIMIYCCTRGRPSTPQTNQCETYTNNNLSAQIYVERPKESENNLRIQGNSTFNKPLDEFSGNISVLTWFDKLECYLEKYINTPEWFSLAFLWTKPECLEDPRRSEFTNDLVGYNKFKEAMINKYGKQEQQKIKETVELTEFTNRSPLMETP
jgi:hypothetical protein